MEQLLATRLLRWYKKEGRDLPWRRTSDPYAIWVSEIMLQQTQVVTVIPYYERFMTAFPTVAELAHAPLGTVLKVWEGLGYYARARNLQKAASIISDQYDGKIPENIETLTSLPGIGRSTAGAIVSIAYGKKAPILDGNVRRVLCRLFAIRQNPSLAPVQKRLWKISERLVPEKNPRSFNQALMDLGATICTPKKPDCTACCLGSLCLAWSKGLQETLPTKSLKRKVPHYHIAVGVIWKGGKVLITQRPAEGLLGGLWEFPGGKLKEGENPSQAAAREILEELNVTATVGELIRTVRHAYSHFRITLHAFHCRYVKGPLKTTNPYRWLSPDELSHYAFPSANRKIIAMLEK